VPDTIKVNQKTIVIAGAAVPGPTPLQIGGFTGTPAAPAANGPAAGPMTLYARNMDGTNAAWLVWGATSAECAANAAAIATSGTPQKQVFLPISGGWVPNLQFTAGTFFTVVAAAGTPNVAILPGDLAPS
jgi:hypothetical protein